MTLCIIGSGLNLPPIQSRTVTSERPVAFIRSCMSCFPGEGCAIFSLYSSASEIFLLFIILNNLVGKYLVISRISANFAMNIIEQRKFYILDMVNITAKLRLLLHIFTTKTREI